MSWKELMRPSVCALAAPHEKDYTMFGRALVRMDLNEAPLAPTADEMAAFSRELAKLDLNRYPEASGRVLRERLAALWRVSPDEILLGNGSVEVIGTLMTAFGAPRDGQQATVLHPDPTYGQYDVMASSYGLRAVGVPLGAAFELDEARALTAIERDRPALAFFPNPNSPTGNCFNLDALQRLARRMDGVFVVDEAYADFAEQTILPRIHATPGLFVMRSLSKIGFAALRVGALIGEREAIAQLDKVRLPYNVNAVSLAFASCVLAEPERLKARIAAIVQLRCELERALRDIDGIEVWPTRANFVLLRTAFPADVIFHRMLARGIVLRVFTPTPRLARCVRITSGTRAENARCVNALADVLAELKREQRRPADYQSRL